MSSWDVISKSIMLAFLLVMSFTVAPAQSHSRESETLQRLKTLILTLDRDTRTRTLFPYDAPGRLRWARSPEQREGLALKEMSANQRELVDEILKSVLSENGFIRAKAIMSDQQVLARNEEGLGAGYYWFAIYGEPGNSGPWAWRIGGHHLSLHFTYVDNSLIGLPVSEFDQNQKTMFLKLIEDYTGVFGSEIAKTRLEKIRQTALTNVYFGWAGSRHSTDAEDYYRIQGPDFLIEYSNTGKHLHSVWRELNDFGIRSRPPN